MSCLLRNFVFISLEVTIITFQLHLLERDYVPFLQKNLHYFCALRFYVIYYYFYSIYILL